ncbi:hypothetical protein GGS26DRAFT_564537 [Hypomontagnella submonticulosa]|nr:hypothetical protein GGS26DRAFT_564537 [Hypomontagnella submonticulosa]
MVRYENYRENHSHSRHHHHHHRSRDHHRRDGHRSHHSHNRNHYPTYEPVEYSYAESYGEPVECKFPRFPSWERFSSIRYTIIVVSCLFLLVAIASQIVIFFFTIKFVNTDNTGFEPENPNFALFKNSRFEECSTLVPDQANCTAIVDILRNAPYELDKEYLNRGYTPISSQWRSRKGIYYDWCTFASCFNGFKVVPSTPRPSVIGQTNFDLWNSLNMSALPFLLTFVKRNWNVYRGKQDECEGKLKELGIIDSAVLIYSICGPIVWWWVSFIRFAIDPVPNSTVSIFAWTTTWLLASNLHYHPYSCILARRQGLKQFLYWFLPILALVQWCATIYVLNVGWKQLLQNGDISQGYDCVEAMMNDAPGTTKCSAQKLCSDATLLSNMTFYWDFLEQGIVTSSIVIFTLLSIVALQPFVFATWRLFTTSEYSWGEQFQRGDVGPVAGPAFAGLIATLVCGLSATVLIKLSTTVNREAPVVADMECTAVHVGLSTWRYYLDLSIYARALRIAEAWFNA